MDSDTIGLWFGALFLGWLIGAIVSYSRMKALTERVARLAEENRRHTAAGTVLYERIETLRLRIETGEARIAKIESAPQAVVPAAPAAETPVVEAKPAEPVAPITEPAAPPTTPAREPVVAAIPPAELATPLIDVAAREAAAPSETAPEAPTPKAEAPPKTEAVPAEPLPVAAATVLETPPPPSEAPPARVPFRMPDWESFVGVRLFSAIAGIAFVLAAVFFLKYSIDQGLLGPPIRLAIGIVTGIIFLVVSETRGRGSWNVMANALSAAGTAILFASFFAGNALWHLIPQLVTFGLMVLVTAVAVLLAIRHSSLFIALLGLVGGFATPIMLSTGDDRPIGLFAYLLVLNAGLAWVGRRRGWTVLIALSVAFTAVYQWGWLVKFVVDKPSELPIAVGVFLAFPVLIALSRLVPAKEDEAPKPAFEHTLAVSGMLPLLFALCFAWVPTLGDHYVLLFAYLFILDVGLVVLAATTRNILLHAASALATLLVFVGWLPAAYGAYAWPLVLAFVSLFVGFFLVAPFAAARLQALLTKDERPPVSLAPVRVAAPLLLFTFPVLLFMEPASASPLLPFGVMFVLLIAIAAVALKENAGALYFLGAFFAVVAEAVWSAKYLSPERLHAALLLYGAFGIFHLGVPLIARRLKKPLEPDFAPAALLLASLALLLFLAVGPIAHLALWGMAILLAILNLGLFFDVRPGRVSVLGAMGMAFSWLVIAMWWATAMVASLLLPALAIVGGFAVLLVGGNLWADRQSAADASGRKAVYLGLVGHLFLLFVASQGALAVPPWPLLGVLFVLDLAIFVAALYAKRAELHVSAITASQVVLVLWVWTTHSLPSPSLAWPQIGMLAALGIAGIALLALPLARRRGVEHVLFPAGAAVALLGVQVVVATAGLSAFASVPWLVVVQALALIALAGIAARNEWHWLVLIALVPYAAGTLIWTMTACSGHLELWREELVVAGVPYLLWLAYPSWLGRRALTSRIPHFAAVLASGLFFLFANGAFRDGQLTSIIGILPVAQAILLVGSLAHLLRLEPSDVRDRGRLALVAGAALAFVTAAIPLQLDKQWITLGWALEAAALAWLYRRIVHKGLLATTAGLALAVVLRLSLNESVLSYHPRGALPIWNWYLYSYLVAGVSLLVSAAILEDTDDRFAELPKLPRISSMTRAGATLLLFLLVNIEIADYWSTGSEITFNFSSGIAQDLTYTLGWALFAMTLLTVGIVRSSRGARLTALLLLVVTALKCFLHDLWRLGGLYRVGSFVGLAVSLALVAVVMQRFVLPPTEKKGP